MEYKKNLLTIEADMIAPATLASLCVPYNCAATTYLQLGAGESHPII